MQSLSAKICERYKIPTVNVLGCINFDAVAKTCLREARRFIMAELLAAEEAEE